MKNILILFICFLFAFEIQAQTEKGKKIFTAGSNLSMVFGNGKLKFGGVAVQDIKTHTISLQPGIGFFLAKNLAFGVGVSVDNVRTEVENITEQQNTFGMAPFVRYFLSDTKVKPYLHVAPGYLKITNEIKQNNQLDKTDSYSGFAVDAGLGLAAFMSDRVAFDALLAYSVGSLSYNGDQNLKLNPNAIGIVLGFSIFF